tara:strand:- start:10856 stop:11590 length:735 start_codon:yes stop_codon:yes gene_type:complete
MFILSPYRYAATGAAATCTHAFDFDGVDEHITFGNILDFTADMTATIWIRVDTTSGLDYVFGKGSVGGSMPGWGVYRYGTKLYVQVRDSSNSYIAAGGNTTINTSTWYHIAAVLDIDGNATLYINGSAEATTGNISSLNGSYSNSWNLCIGAREGTSIGFYWDGKCAWSTIYDKALSSGEVSEDYNSGAPLDPTTHSAASNLVFWVKPDADDISSFPTVTEHDSGNDGTMVNCESGDIQDSVIP